MQVSRLLSLTPLGRRCQINRQSWGGPLNSARAVLNHEGRVRLGLRGSAVLIAAAMAIASPSRAEDIKLSLGGFFTGVGAATDKNGPVGEADMPFGSDAELHVRGTTLLNNGIEVGFFGSYVINDNCAVGKQTPAPPVFLSCIEDDVNQVFVDLQTGLGKLRVGQTRSVASQLMIATPTPFGRISADNAELDPLALGNVNSALDDSGHGVRVVYVTPGRPFGLQLGVSYLYDPDEYGPLVTIVPDPLHPNSNGKTAFAAAVNFEREISEVVLRGAVAYYLDNRRNGAQDPQGYNIGLQLGYGAFTLGGNFTKGDNMDHRTSYLNESETNIWSAGVTWGSGPWLVGVNYADGEDKLDGTSADFNSLVGGLSYEFGEHFKVGLGYQHDDANPLAGASADGNAVFMETGLKF